MRATLMVPQGVGLVLALMVLCMTMPCGHAGTITALDRSVGPGLGRVAVVASDSPLPENDNDSDKHNFYSLDVRFDNTGVIDMVFVVSDDIPFVTNPTREYWLEASVVNNTRNDWVQFTFELGFGTGANFVRTDSPLDFDYPDYDPEPRHFTRDPFLDLSIQSNSLIFYGGGSVAAAGSVSFFWEVDVPNLDPNWVPAEYIVGGGYQFTIRIEPYSPAAAGESRPNPEPSTLALMGLGVLGLLGYGWRRRRRPRGCQAN